MSQFNIADAKANFSKLVRKAMLGEEVIIAKDNRPVLKLVPLEMPKQPRTPGSGKGQILYIAPDFDAIREGFENYVSPETRPAGKALRCRACRRQQFRYSGSTA